MRSAHCRTWNMARKLKPWEMRQKQCRISYMARKSEKRGK